MPIRTAPLPDWLVFELPPPVADPGWPPQVRDQPTRVSSFRIDWAWESASEPQREVLRRWAARAERTDVRLEWLSAVLTAASAQAQNEIVARVELDDGERVLVTADRGRLHIGLADGARAARFDAHDHPGIILPEAADFAAAGIDRIERNLLLPPTLRAALQARAVAEDLSISAVLSRAWSIALPFLARQLTGEDTGLVLPPPPPAGERAQWVFVILPPRTLGELERTQERSDRSNGWLLSLAWRIAEALEAEARR